MNKFLLVLVIAAALTLTFGSCGVENSACEDCKSAMEHMAEKIHGQWCDPAYMENAQEGIRNSCGTEMSDEFIGYLADACISLGGMPEVPSCQGDKWPPIEEMTVDNPLMWVITSNLPDSVIIRLEPSVGLGLSETIVGPSGYFYVNSGDDISEGTIYTIVLKDKQGSEIMTATKEFTFVRTNEWDEIRTIEVNYDQGSLMYSLGFEYWGN